MGVLCFGTRRMGRTAIDDLNPAVTYSDLYIGIVPHPWSLVILTASSLMYFSDLHQLYDSKTISFMFIADVWHSCRDGLDQRNKISCYIQWLNENQNFAWTSRKMGSWRRNCEGDSTLSFVKKIFIKFKAVTVEIFQNKIHRDCKNLSLYVSESNNKA